MKQETENKHYEDTDSIDIGDHRNLSMLFDFYEATMANGYILSQRENTIAVFDLFFRRIPDLGGYVVMSGLSQVISYLKNLHFTEKDIKYLQSKKIFSQEFLDYLSSFKFTCDLYSFKEGSIIFPHEPILTVVGPLIQAQLVETMLLLCINHQSLIATKASRITRVANGRPVMEFGSRRAQGFDGAIFGARAAYVGGCDYTSCAYSDEYFNIPAIGTMAHSWIQSFDSEYEAFKVWAKTYPDNCVLLIDTYHVIDSGMKNALKVFKEVLEPLGKKPKGIRIDSGDLIVLTQQCRKMLNDAGYNDCKIIVSNSLDEYAIGKLLNSGACIDSFGVGERLITAKSEPVFGGVYKLVAVKKGEIFEPRIKLSETTEKITNPGFKKIVRLFDKKSNMAICDVLCLKDEKITEQSEIQLNDGTLVNNFYVKETMVPVFQKGECVYPSEKLDEVKNRVKEGLAQLDKHLLALTEIKEHYPVVLSKELRKLKNDLIAGYNKI